MSSSLSKSEYLKKYLSKPGTETSSSSEHRDAKLHKHHTKRKHRRERGDDNDHNNSNTKKKKNRHNNLVVVDEEVSWKDIAPSASRTEAAWEEIASDEDAPVVVAMEEPRKSVGTWEESSLQLPGKRSKGSSPSPPRRRRATGDSDDDASPPRRNGSASPPRRRRSSPSPSPPRRRATTDHNNNKTMRGDSYDDSPPRRTRAARNSHEDSPPRRKGSSSPPRRRRRRSSPSPSPPRRKATKDMDDDISPPRRRRSSPSPSPPRRRPNSTVDDASPPRRRRSSPSPTPPRRRPNGTVDDASPPRRRRSSPSPTPPRRRPNGTVDDASPPRRRRSSPSPSPPRRRPNGTVDDASPPRRRRSSPSPTPPRRKATRDMDDDISPPRRRRSSPSPSPPRRNKRAQEEAGPSPSRAEESPARKSYRAGLQSSSDLAARHEELKEQRAKEVEEANRQQASSSTVYRDKRGKKLDMLNEFMRQSAVQKGKEEKLAQAQYEWGRGTVQKQQTERTIQELEAMADAPFARTIDDAALEKEKKAILRDGDPMAEYFRSKQESVETAVMEDSGVSSKPRYKGPAAAPNRFGILPGYRWDAVDRGNGFESRLLKKISERGAFKEDEYRWSTSDIIFTTLLLKYHEKEYYHLCLRLHTSDNITNEES